ncbi:MAG TPA: M23 family metallopeptidase [Myxococcota bacterium]|nr:M23 family metallopeptidase [Myxococcota bacterium]
MELANQSYTILIVPERSAKVQRVKLPKKTLVNLAFAAVGVLALLMFMLVHYAFIVDQATENVALKDENVVLKTRLRVVQDEIARIDATLQRIDQFSARIRAITQLNDPDRNLAMGPLSNDPNAKPPEVLYASGERIDYEDEQVDSKLALRLIDSNLDHLETDSLRTEENARQLHEYFADQDALLVSTPSLRPTRSKLLTSAFGMRTDPYTDHQVMHKGVDFAADHGADVVSPADGIVIFVGNRGNGYGKTVVIDHGYGIQTHYAHLASFSVEVGQRVKRGQVVAAVGNTGRSTGAHLHYEVRFSGIPQDPEKFILD